MANLRNLEVGVERAMKAYLKEAGATDAQAASRTKAKLAQGVAFIRDNFVAGEVDPDAGAVFAQLKTWTLANA